MPVALVCGAGARAGGGRPRGGVGAGAGEQGRDVQPGALVIGRHCVTERDSAPVQYNGIV